jgi:tripartite-type tricarboxylate transporter receptor subunit TctC
LVGPAGLPASAINAVHAAVAKVMTEPAVQQRFATEGAVAQRETPERFGHFIQTEMKRWKDVAQAASIQL